jgi:hypothetical protein
MSKIALVSPASGTATFSITTPSGTSTDRTLTLPDAAGTIQVSGNPISGTTGSFSGDLSFNSGYGSAAVAYGCRAWGNFNGANGSIRSSGNVSSVTRNATGDYTVNFATAMPDTNYSLTAMAGNDNATAIGTATYFRLLTTSIRFETVNQNATLVDRDIVSVAIFR